jgi:hypothetical protein
MCAHRKVGRLLHSWKISAMVWRVEKSWHFVVEVNERGGNFHTVGHKDVMEIIVEE